MKCEVIPIGLFARVVMSSFSHSGEFFLSQRVSLSLTEGIFFSHKGYLFLSQRVFFSLTERTEFTELFGARFELTEGLRHTEFTEASPPTPLRMERGVVCEVTPIRLLIGGEDIRIMWRTCRGISVITPLSIRRGAGGEAPER